MKARLTVTVFSVSVWVLSTDLAASTQKFTKLTVKGIYTLWFSSLVCSIVFLSDVQISFCLVYFHFVFYEFKFPCLCKFCCVECKTGCQFCVL